VKAELEEAYGVEQERRKVADRSLKKADKHAEKTDERNQQEQEQFDREMELLAEKVAMAQTRFSVAEEQLKEAERSRVQDKLTRDAKLEEARRAEAEARAQKELQEESLQMMKASNVELRAEVLTSREAAQAAEKALNEVREVETLLRTEIGKKTEEVTTLTASGTQLRLDFEAASKEKMEVEQRSTERIDAAEARARAAEACVADIKKAKLQLHAELQAKSDEAGRLVEACVALKGEIAQACEATQRAEERATAAQADVAEAKLAEISVRADLEVKANVVADLTASNVALRALAAEAQDREEAAAKRAVAAESAANIAHEAELIARSQLQAKSEEAFKLKVACDEHCIALNVSKAECEQKHQLALDAEAAGADARRKELLVAAELQAESDERGRLANACAALKLDIQLREEELVLAKERAATAESSAEAALKAEAYSRAELEIRADMLARLKDANGELHALVGKAQGQIHEVENRAARATAKASEAEQEASSARENQLAAESKLQAKTDEVTNLEAACSKLRNDAAETQQLAEAKEAESTARMAWAEKAMAWAEKGTADARAVELQAQADLKVQHDEVARLSDACAAIGAELKHHRDEAVAAKFDLEVLRSALTVACEAVAKAANCDVERVREELTATVKDVRRKAEKKVSSAANGEADGQTLHPGPTAQTHEAEAVVSEGALTAEASNALKQSPSETSAKVQLDEANPVTPMPKVGTSAKRRNGVVAQRRSKKATAVPSAKAKAKGAKAKAKSKAVLGVFGTGHLLRRRLKAKVASAAYPAAGGYSSPQQVLMRPRRLLTKTAPEETFLKRPST
jgi:hypothetical protein